MLRAPLAPKKNVIVASSLKNFHLRLSRWYKTHGRHDLPWRNTRDPYAIYLSEIMLQQTQVETVRARFYAPFLKKFPTVAALAKASHEEVLSAWQGLGYYRRAGHLHAAAKACKTALPKDVEGLIALPGIGRNTAHAIAAFAYKHPVAILEANVKRVVARIFALETPTEAELWAGAEAILNKNDPFDYNQAMMDLGSQVCTPRAPKCGQCPASVICKGKADPESYPARKAKKAVPIRKKHIVLLVDAKGHISATPRATKFLQGLYHFDEREAAPKGARKIGAIEQKYSHFTLQADVYLLSHRQKRNDAYSIRDLHTLPMSMAEKKILRLLAAHGKDAA